MPSDKEALQKKWWFFAPAFSLAIFSQSALLRAAGMSTDLENSFSPIAFIHYSVLLGLFYFYFELGAFLLVRVWSRFVSHTSGEQP